MKFVRLDLLTLLISLFILAGCKNPDSIGLGVDPAKAIQANLIDTVTINTTTATDDTIATSNVTKAPLAFFKDPTFGTTEANIVSTLNLPGSAAFTTPTDPVTIDSAVLILNYAKGAYGDLTTTYTATVNQLAEPVMSNQTYYNNKAWKVSSTVVGSKTFVPRPSDSIKIYDIVTGGPDTLKKVAPQLRIKLNTAFFASNFFGASASALATNAVFQNVIKGLFITLNGTTVSLAHPGGTLFFDMSASPEVALYYKVKHVSANPDTLLTALALGSPLAVQIKHDYTINPAIVSQLNNPNTSASTVYIQGLAGLRCKVSFPNLTGKGKNLLHDIRKSSYAANPAVDTNGIVDYAINRAELHITPVTGTVIPYAPLPRMTLYRYDIARQRTYVPDAYSSDPRYLSVGSFGGFFDTYHQSYSFVVTAYVDDLLRGKLNDYGTFIAPADSTGMSTGTVSNSISSSSGFDGRSVLGGNKISAYKMKLNILYNKVTK
jgi:hypothetical protein